MMKNFIVAIALPLFLYSFQASGQTPSSYQIATWYNFKNAAVTYSLDDNTANQVPVAVPIFNKFNYKATLNIVTNSQNLDWSPYNKLSKSGYEITSHSVTHRSLNTLNLEEQEAECKDSKKCILQYVPHSRCETIAYPYCVNGNLSILQKHYIAARGCSGQIIPSTPNDFYNISSIGVGGSGIITSQGMNKSLEKAFNLNGWCVFLIHGIDNDGGYAPIESTMLEEHLTYVNQNSGNYWVSTFANVVKYIRERNALKITETAFNNDSLLIQPTDSLDNKIYNVPVTIRRKIPDNWTSARVYQGEELIPFSIIKEDNGDYIQFDVIPDVGTYSVARVNTESSDNDGWTIVCASADSEYTLTKKGAKGLYKIIDSNGMLVTESKFSEKLSIGKNLALGEYSIILKENKGQTTIKKIIIKKQ